MHKFVCALAAWALASQWASASAQPNPQELLQKLATVKESVARSQASLREYSWTERTTISVKGEARRSEVAFCRYLPDDRLQRTPVVESQEPRPGLKARMFEMKSTKLEAYSQRLLALSTEYMPPSPRLMSTAHEAGNVSLGSSPPGSIILNFKSYVVPGDAVRFDFDSTGRALRQVFVTTYLDPKDPVTIFAAFATLTHGTTYVASSTLEEKTKGIQITIQNSNYQKIEQ